MSQKPTASATADHSVRWNRGKIIYLAVGVACCAFGVVQIVSSLN
jgi:hypothetical protein